MSRADLLFTFGSDVYLVNPVELTTPVIITDNGKQYTACLTSNSFQTPLNGEQVDMEFLLRDISMHNVYFVCVSPYSLPFTRHELTRDLHGSNYGNSTTSVDDSRSASIFLLSNE
ncbi:hypothetical protein BDN67DRAFT_428141 [Paxillus ammoniavirescens]|nr:hypothetical protein BDN67DRAFT_428141 [Paxillus ammoniavirescens]